MSNLIEANIPPEAYVAEPFSVDEIDAHPDSARIWRTIKEVRDTLRHGGRHMMPAYMEQSRMDDQPTRGKPWTNK